MLFLNVNSIIAHNGANRSREDVDACELTTKRKKTVFALAEMEDLDVETK